MRVISKEQLKDRLRAFAVFAGIGVGAVAGFEMIIGGGFDPLTPAMMYARPEKTGAYERQYIPYTQTRRPYTPTRYSVTPATYELEPARAEGAELALAGGPSGEIGSSPDELDEAALRAQIELLYAAAQAGDVGFDEDLRTEYLPAPHTVGEDYSFVDSDITELTGAGGR